MLFNIQNTTAYKIRPAVNSNDTAWINWHKALKSDIGQAQAATIFLGVWGKQGSSHANTVALRQYLAPQGITIDESAWDKVADLGSNVGGAISSFGNHISNVFKFGEYAAGATVIIVIAGLAMVIYNIGKDPGKAAGTAAKFAV